MFRETRPPQKYAKLALMVPRLTNRGVKLTRSCFLRDLADAAAAATSECFGVSNLLPLRSGLLPVVPELRLSELLTSADVDVPPPAPDPPLFITSGLFKM